MEFKPRRVISAEERAVYAAIARSKNNKIPESIRKRERTKELTDALGIAPDGPLDWAVLDEALRRCTATAESAFTDDDISEAVEASGYPLEVTLFNRLTELGTNPVLGFLAPVSAAGELEEIDLLATIGGTKLGDPMPDRSVLQSLRLEVRLVIGVKKLHPPSRVVGIFGAQPDARSRRGIRTSLIAGLPSYGIVNEVFDQSMVDVLMGKFLGRAFAFDDAVPYCPHWVIVRKKGTLPFASSSGTGSDDAGDRYYDDIKSSFLASYFLSRDWTNFLLTKDTFDQASAYVSLYQPVLVVGTDELLVHDPLAHGLGRTDWIVLQRSFEIAPGRQLTRAIDIVTPAGLERLIASIRAAQDLGLTDGFDGVHNIAAKQHQKWTRLPERRRRSLVTA